MSLDTDMAQPSLGGQAIFDDQVAATEGSKPTPFSLKAQMLDQGRTDTVLAATEDLSVRLKVYASGGENALHAHVDEDHVFVLLQGSARFYGPDGEALDLEAHQGMMMPKGLLYRFHATSEDECLVMLRIGTPNFQKQASVDRIGRDGNPLAGDSKENKSVPVIFRDGAYFGD
ncbi:MAG: cupin domain-containing protein [Alphaproteobacteria bacterium]|jgi:mannose-6-phosphate isomerase-like protein (cupin superfamily)|nr:cupin domain-containing protein [Alphaproteobacteria bacterium]